jgi:DNA modification methylase
MPESCVDAIVCDPPYFLGIEKDPEYVRIARHRLGME